MFAVLWFLFKKKTYRGDAFCTEPIRPKSRKHSKVVASLFGVFPKFSEKSLSKAEPRIIISLLLSLSPRQKSLKSGGVHDLLFHINRARQNANRKTRNAISVCSINPFVITKPITYPKYWRFQNCRILVERTGLTRGCLHRSRCDVTGLHFYGSSDGQNWGGCRKLPFTHFSVVLLGNIKEFVTIFKNIIEDAYIFGFRCNTSWAHSHDVDRYK